MQNLSFVTRGLTVGLLLGLAGFSGSAAGQDDQNLNDARNKPPCATPASVTLDYVEYEVLDLVKYMAETSCRNLILGGDDLKGKVTIISHKPVPYWTAFSAMESALATAGYTMVEVGGAFKVLPTSKASQAPVAVYEGSSIPATDRVVTQIFQMENTSVSDISSIARRRFRCRPQHTHACQKARACTEFCPLGFARRHSASQSRTQCCRCRRRLQRKYGL